MLVRTVNTQSYIGDNANKNPIRLKGIAKKIHEDYQGQIGLVGMQEAKGDMTGCKIDRTLNNAAQCLAGELAFLFESNAQGRHTGGDMDVESGIVVGNNWKIISSKHWGIHSTFFGIGSGHRKLIEVLVKHKTTGVRLRFYSTHLSPNDKSKDERENQATEIIKKIKERAKMGELPPIVVGDFNAGRNFRTGEAEKSVRMIENDFWRPIDSFISDSTGTGVNIVYIGRKSSFPNSNGKYAPIERIILN